MKLLYKDILFQPFLHTGSLGRESVCSGLTVISTQGIYFLLSIASTVIIARILSPGDYGLVGMVAVFIAFAEMFKDAGLSTVTIQSKTITHDMVSNLFWINVLVSLLFGIIILVSSPFIAEFYGKPELAPVAVALSLSFVISGIFIQHQALLKRHMQFVSLGVIQITSQLVGIIVTIALAVLGWAYWALIVGTIVNTVSGALITVYFCRWVPGRLKRGTGVREMLRFGGNITGFGCLNYFARSLDNILIGRFLGATALGYYSRAYQMLMSPITMISGPLGGVIVPVLSRLSSDKQRLQDYYLNTLYMLALVACPITAIFFISSKEVVLLLLGNSWLSVSEVFRFMAIGALLQPLYNTQAWLHIAKGRADRVFLWGLIGTPIIAASFGIGLLWGINGVAGCYSIAVVVTTSLSLAYAGSSADIPFLRIVASVSKPLISILLAVLASEIAKGYFGLQSSIAISLIFNLSVFCAFYICFLSFFYMGFKPMNDLMHLIRLLNNKSVAEAI